jgi:SAM-dependent methyltransferase
VLDAGCGTGVLGIALAARDPGVEVTAVDRDALAVAMTAANARLNGIDRLRAEGGLILDNRQQGPFDLVVSNIPAKAGPPVLRRLVARLADLARGGGRVAVVVVAPLAGFVRESIAEAGLRTLVVEEGRGHSVFHYAGAGKAGEAAAGIAPFVRQAGRFEAGGRGYEMVTAYGLPGFDTIGYEEDLALAALEGQAPGGAWAFWRPGQGHVPAALLARHRGAAASLTLGARDLLAVEVARVNAVTAGMPAEQVTMTHAPFYGALDGAADLFVFLPDDDPGWRWQEGFAEAAADRVRSGGLLLAAGPSGMISRVVSFEREFRLVGDQRRRGFRALLLRRI